MSIVGKEIELLKNQEMELYLVNKVGGNCTKLSSSWYVSFYRRYKTSCKQKRNFSL